MDKRKGTKQSDEKTSYFVQHINIIKLLMTQWASALKPTELVVLFFINERTFRWNKASERIPMGSVNNLSHFLCWR